MHGSSIRMHFGGNSRTACHLHMQTAIARSCRANAQPNSFTPERCRCVRSIECLSVRHRRGDNMSATTARMRPKCMAPAPRRGSSSLLPSAMRSSFTKSLSTAISPSSSAKVFFPAADEAVSILVTFGTFGISFLARPVGAIFLGAYGDRKGRKQALTLSILLMTIGTGLMTVMPSYGSVGVLAPILVIARPPAARLFRRRRVRQLDRIPRRAPARSRRVFRQLAMVEPGVCRRHRHRLRRLADDDHVGRPICSHGAGAFPLPSAS